MSMGGGAWSRRSRRSASGARLSGEALAAYLEGEVTPSEAAAVEAVLSGSATDRGQLEEMRAIRAALKAPVPEVESRDIAAGVAQAIARLKMDEAVRVRDRRPWWWRIGTLAVASGMALVVGGLFLLRPPRTGPAPASTEDSAAAEFRARSAAPQGSALGEGRRWAGLQVYRVAGAGSEPERLGLRMRRDDGLLFAYTNLGPRPFDYLMVFGIDARGAVRWYHPSFERVGTNPASIPVEKGVARAVLKEVIRHDLAAGRLQIVALFTRQALTVADVEGWVAASASGLDPKQLPWSDAYIELTETEVAALRAGP